MSLTLAAAVYAGQPDMLVLLVVGMAVFAVVLLVLRARASGIDAIVPAAGDLVIASIVGMFLAAPVLLPGLELVTGSIRSAGGGALNAQHALSLAYLVRLVFPVGSAFFYYKYFGAIALVLVLTAIIFRYRRREVAALIAMTVVVALLTTSPLWSRR